MFHVVACRVAFISVHWHVHGYTRVRGASHGCKCVLWGYIVPHCLTLSARSAVVLIGHDMVSMNADGLSHGW